MKNKNYDFVDYGFKFRVIDSDYDFIHAKSLPYKYNRNNWQRALKYKEENEHDFCYDERDCTGSTCVRIELKVKRNGVLYVYYYWNKDV